MKNKDTLIDEIRNVRTVYIDTVSFLSDENTQWKPIATTWNILEITEHLYWAEYLGTAVMWKTLHQIRAGKKKATSEFKNSPLTIEQIVAQTWKPKEIVPDIAAPRIGGSFEFWLHSFKGLQVLVDEFGNSLLDEELPLEAHAHPISGPLSFHQRLEFLRFHIERHQLQAQKLIDQLP